MFQGSRECRNSKEMPQMPADCFFQPFPQQPTAFFCGFSTSHWVCSQKHVCVSRWVIIWRDEALRFHCDAKPPSLHDLLDKTGPPQRGRCKPFGRQGRETYLGNILQVWKGLRHSFVSSFYFLLQSQALSCMTLGMGCGQENWECIQVCYWEKKPAAACGNRAL